MHKSKVALLHHKMQW